MDKKIVSLKHGEGTKAYRQLINDVFLAKYGNKYLNQLNDSADLGRYVFTCDSFTVEPIFFGSCDIGKLSVFGTVNDICVSAATPLYLSCALIVEEGFLLNDLERIASSIKEAARESGIEIVTGDLKVVEKGKADKVFITTSGIGRKIKGRLSSPALIKDKDSIIITGPIAEHGIAVMLARKKIFDFDIESDCASLHYLGNIWRKFGQIRFMRDPTRGGIAAVLNEINLATGLGVRLFEEDVPIREDVYCACEILGIDPYYLASEGRAVIVAGNPAAKAVLKAVKKYSGEARIIGQVDKKTKGVVVNTIAGGERMLDFSRLLNIPRIC